MQRLDDLDVQGKRVLVRVDFNVPLDDNGHVTSDARIEAALPTIRAILERGGRPILMSHLGRPKGKVVDSMRMLPVAERFQELTGFDVRTAPDCIGEQVQDLALGLQEGEVLVLENLRFHAEETDGDADFAKQLAALAEVYVNDAFGTCHRAHASVAGVPQHLPSAPGYLVEKEIESFGRVLREPARPFVAILGGAKVSDKLPVIHNLLPKVDALLIGGAMAYTFLKAQGLEVGSSRVEEDLLEESQKLLAEAESQGKRLILPTDHVAATSFAEDSPYEICGPAIPAGLMGLDIGGSQARLFSPTQPPRGEQPRGGVVYGWGRSPACGGLAEMLSVVEPFARASRPSHPARKRGPVTGTRRGALCERRESTKVVNGRASDLRSREAVCSLHERRPQGLAPSETGVPSSMSATG
jgi:phosphoglycerate kinase